METPIIEMSDVSFAYGSRTVLENISLTIYARDVLAVIGPNGGGKSTLIKLIVGLLKPSSGQLSVFGVSPRQSRQRIGYLAQRSAANLEYPISVLDTVLISRIPSSAFGFGRKSDRDKAFEKLTLVGVESLWNRPIQDLSGGERQRVFLARALMNDPDLLILDEPTNSIDSKAEFGFYELIQTLAAKMSVLMISHDISAVVRYVTNVACLNKRLVYHGGTELSVSDLEETYQCPVDMIAHGVPHRVLKRHD